LNFSFLPKTKLEQHLSRIPGMYYVAYRMWHRRAYRLAEQLHRECPFDLVHQSNMCGFREPGYLWKLGAPFAWGPIGGTQNFPARMLAEGSPREAVSEVLRSTLNWLQLRLSRRVHQAARRADVMLVANTTIEQQFERVVGRNAEVMCEIGTKSVVERIAPTRSDGVLRLLWAGECRLHKALSLLLKAMAELPDGIRVELRVLGDGPSLMRWQRLARNLGVDDRIQWLGWLPHNEALAQYTWADLFVFTSLRDTTGTVILEALSNGVPVLAGNHQGVGDLVTSDSGIKVEVTTAGEMVQAYRDALVQLAMDHVLRERLSGGARQRAKDYLWKRQGERMRDYYKGVLGDCYLWSDRETASPQAIDAEASAVEQEVMS
jgi:glycosyltransferase involved in cell wall biosynthesis